MIELFAKGASAPAEGPLERASTANDSSPQADAPIALAVKATRFLPSPTVSAFAGAAMAVAVGALAMRRAFA
jgi:hypothetical protein